MMTSELSGMQRIRFSLNLLVVCGLSLLLAGCFGIRPPRGAKSRIVSIETTAYCPCKKCCSWKRSWVPPFRPVYASGPSKGKPKKVGLTASGKKARKGTVAADTRYYSFGTVMEIPGYGMGRVDDTGGAIKGAQRIDLFFKSHRQALKWGRRRVNVRVWTP